MTICNECGIFQNRLKKGLLCNDCFQKLNEGIVRKRDNNSVNDQGNSNLKSVDDNLNYKQTIRI